MNTLLSVIVPFYNDERYFERCLESLQEQSIDKRVEFILVDDGSTDRSLKIAEAFLAKNPQQFRVLHQSSSGSGVARNHAIRESKGAYLGFVDSDDWIAPGMFSQMLGVALDMNADVVICDFFKVYETGKKRAFQYMKTGDKGVAPAENKTFVFDTGFSPWNKMIRKELLVQNDLFFAEGILHQDMAVLPAVFAKSNKIINVSKPLYYHFVRRGSSVHSWNEKVYDIFKALDYLKVRLPALYKDEMEYLAIKELFYHVLPDQYRSGEAYRKFFDYAVVYFLSNYPSWEDNPYVRASGRIHRLYLQLLLKGLIGPIVLASRFKSAKRKWLL